MRCGKKSTAQRIVYDALDTVEERTGKPALEVFNQAVDNIRPRLEVKSRRVGGATYQVPIEVSADRQLALTFRWLIMFSGGRRGMGLAQAMANEILDAAQGQGACIKRRDDTHKMAQANKAFAHYRW
jgi:small subunit ribosomal protein S7